MAAKVKQENPQTDETRYVAYAAAAITGILTANPKFPPSLVAAIANDIAQQTIFEQNRVKQIYDSGYTNLY